MRAGAEDLAGYFIFWFEFAGGFLGLSSNTFEQFYFLTAK